MADLYIGHNPSNDGEKFSPDNQILLLCLLHKKAISVEVLIGINASKLRFKRVFVHWSSQLLVGFHRSRQIYQTEQRWHHSEECTLFNQFLESKKPKITSGFVQSEIQSSKSYIFAGGRWCWSLEWLVWLLKFRIWYFEFDCLIVWLSVISILIWIFEGEWYDSWSIINGWWFWFGSSESKLWSDWCDCWSMEQSTAFAKPIGRTNRLNALHYTFSEKEGQKCSTLNSCFSTDFHRKINLLATTYHL